jgi:ClpP class serine protease
MDWTIVIWGVLLLLFVAPAARLWMVQMARTRAIRRLEQRRQSRVIVLIHRQEILALLGLPLLRYIDIDDSESVLRAIKLTDPDVPIDVVLHTPGGLVLAAELIANALCCREAPTTVFVPHYAMSGGTLIALAANEIVMDPNAVLGPVDPQVGRYPAASVLSAVARKSVNEVDDETLILADVAEKALRQMHATVTRIASQRMERDVAAALANALSTGLWTHDYPIGVEEARNMGLPVSTEMPQEVYDLMRLYPQSAARRPSVGYIPVPYRRRRDGGGHEDR